MKHCVFLLTEDQLKYLRIKNCQLPLHLEKSQNALARTWGKHQISSCHFQDIGAEMTIGNKHNEWERKKGECRIQRLERDKGEITMLPEHFFNVKNREE